VIADFRAPDVLRFGFAPLYIRYQDAWDAVSVLTRVMADKTYRLDAYRRVRKVT
jgi:kynureninase